jgi:hypothetical protein
MSVKMRDLFAVCKYLEDGYQTVNFPTERTNVPFNSREGGGTFVQINPDNTFTLEAGTYLIWFSTHSRNTRYTRAGLFSGETTITVAARYAEPGNSTEISFKTIRSFAESTTLSVQVWAQNSGYRTWAYQDKELEGLQTTIAELFVQKVG